MGSDPTKRSGGLTDALVAARPVPDAAAIESARARAELALFGTAEAPRLGRFVLLNPIAGGGMGMIHRAYDPHLDRAVALKLLHPQSHPTERARARLLDEARVLARLDHPNIVPVHDVVEIDGQVVIVMELVEGQTFAEWEHEKRRRWRDIVEVYLQAGRGLVAAHDHGVVHRDFKPANAIVGNDGRVRVLDFGLARFTATERAQSSLEFGVPSTSEQPALLAPPPMEPLTAAGEIVGTLGYMAPEQLMGGKVTAASDQFSFCVSLYRSLYGVAPFAGNGAAERVQNIGAGRITPPADSSLRIPAWLRDVVVRGLAAAPEDRHPSMHTLLDQLGRERGWRRWRWVALAAMMPLVAIGSILVATSSRTDGLAACDGGIDEVGRVWNPTRSQQLRHNLARIATPYARAIEGQLLAALDGYRDRWSNTHRAACAGYRADPRNPGLAAQFERKRRCLDLRLRDLASAVDVLVEVNSSSVANAIDVAARLPRVEMCGNSETLPEEVDPPASVAARNQVDAVREQLSRANALQRGGRSADALTLAEGALAAANRVGYPPAVLEAELVKGTILALTYDNQAAVAPLARAEVLAHEQHLYDSAVVAGARRIYAEGLLGANLDRLAGQVDELERLSRGLRDNQFARPLLLNYIGVLYMVRGERARATEYFRAARKSLAGIGSPDLELNAIDMNLAMITPDRAERERLALGAWKRYSDQLGPNHITTLSQQCRYAHYVLDPEIALDLLRSAGDLYRRFHPSRIRDRSICLSYQAFLTTEISDPARLQPAATAIYAEVAGVGQGTSDDDDGVRSRARLARGYISLYQGRPKLALDQFTAVIEEYAHSPNWWDEVLGAQGHLGAGLAEEALGEPLKAEGHLELALETFDRLMVHNEDVEYRQRLALARLSLARVLRHRAPGRALELQAQASAFYREANSIAYQKRLDALAP